LSEPPNISEDFMKTVLLGILFCCICSFASAAETLENKLNKIVIKEFACEEAQAKDVFELVRQKSKEADPEGKGINFVFQDYPEGGAIVTISLNDIPLGKLIEYICISSKLKYKVDTHAVIIYKDKKEEKKPAK